MVLILLGLLARLWFVASGQLNLVQDEAQYWDWTRRLQFSYYSKGPLIAWIIHLWTEVFGDTELGVRFGAVVGATLNHALLFAGMAFIFRRPVAAAWAAFIAFSTPLFLASGVLMTTDNPLLTCWIVCIFGVYLLCDDTRTRQTRLLAAIAMGIFFGIGILAKYPMLLFAPMALAYAGLLYRAGRLPERALRWMLFAFVGGMVIGFLPILIWNALNDWVGFKHVFHLVGVSGKQAERFIRFDRFPDYIGGQIGLITPWWLAFMLLGGWQAVRCMRRRGPAWQEQGQSTDDSRICLLLALTFWPLWLLLLAWSFHAKVHPNWPSFSYPAGIMLAGLALADFWQQGRDAATTFWQRRRHWFVAAGLGVFLLLHLAPLAPLPDSINPLHRLKGWEDLGAELATQRDAHFADPSRVFYFSDVYDMTAALAFYVPGQPITYCYFHGRRMAQYDIWPGPQDKQGWDALYVRKGFKDGVEPGVDGLFARMEGPFHYQSTFNGAPARKFTIYRCYDYNGRWPTVDNPDF